MWLHVPRLYLSAPEAVDSTLALDSLCEELAQSVTWREKQLKPASWRRVLNRAGWLTRLSGLTCSASMRERGVASWMASLAASRASLTVSQASGSESTTNATSGPTFSEWYTNPARLGASSRTSQASLIFTGESYDPTLKALGSRLRRESSQRRRSARLIFGNASSGWPMATVQDGENNAGASQWERNSFPLNVAAVNWPTPSTAPDAPNTNSNTVNGPTSLGEAATLWQTPGTDSFRSRGGDRKDEQGLDQQSRSWATPRTNAGTGAWDGHDGGDDLQTMARDWLSPPVELSRQVHQATGQDGSTSGRVLNPRFVEMLMGWPSGATDYESSAMGLCLSQWRSLFGSLLERLD